MGRISQYIDRDYIIQRLESGADIDNLTKSGIYYTLSHSVANSIVNIPSDLEGLSAFTLYVTTNETQCVQIFVQKVDTSKWYSNIYFRAKIDGKWKYWNKAYTTQGGVVNGLIQNYGGLGFFFNSYAGNERWIPFCEFTSQNVDSVTGSCIVSSPGDYGIPLGGMYMLEVGSRWGKAYAICDCIHPYQALSTRPDNVHFGYWKDPNEDKFHVGCYVKSYHNRFNIIPLNTTGRVGSVTFYNRGELSEAPEGWTEIPIRELMDKDQVLAMIQVEIEKIKT